jgi:hypothetical protein
MNPTRTPLRSPHSSNPTGPQPGTAMQDIQLHLNIDELNLILEGVGNLPFARVYGLVGKIQAQAAEQLQAPAAGSAGLMPPNVTPMAVAKA